MDCFVLWNYPIWVQCLNNFVADCVSMQVGIGLFEKEIHLLPSDGKIFLALLLKRPPKCCLSAWTFSFFLSIGPNCCLVGASCQTDFALCFVCCMNCTCSGCKFMRSLCIACANCAQNKRHIYFKSWLFIKHHPNGKLKNIMAFFCKILFIEGKKVLLNFMSTEKRKV